MIDVQAIIFRCTWDIAIFILAITLHWLANRQDRMLDVPVPDSSAQLLATACTGGIVAVSILASAAMQTLSTDRLTLSCSTICHPTMRSVVWFVASIFAGLFVLSLLPMYAPATDARRRPQVFVAYFAQFLALVIGAIWLLAAIWVVL